METQVQVVTLVSFFLLFLVAGLATGFIRIKIEIWWEEVPKEELKGHVKTVYTLGSLALLTIAIVASAITYISDNNEIPDWLVYSTFWTLVTAIIAVLIVRYLIEFRAR